jgi:D-glycero-D-manno-heptose 1,7-bisphosphate phosphatase
MNKAIFFDRDGVLNIDPGFLHKKEDLEFYPDVIDTLTQLSQTGYKIFIVTNQAGIARGFYSEQTFLDFQKQFVEELVRLSNGEIRIDKTYHCPHHATEGIDEYKLKCECRKPQPGMLLQAQKEFDIDFAQSYMIGDRRSDIIAGREVGCTTILVKTGCAGKGGSGDEVSPDYTVQTLSEILNIIK